jgi:hypothetical protein
MDLGENELKITGGFGLLMAVFFVTGFMAGNTLNTGSNVANQNQQGTEVTQEEALQKGVSSLESGPMSYPFTYNLSTVSVNEHEISGTSFYNWTVSYTVEANPLQGPIYSVPRNATSTEKTLTLYLSRDGEYLFQSPPVRTTRQG